MFIRSSRKPLIVGVTVGTFLVALMVLWVGGTVTATLLGLAMAAIGSLALVVIRSSELVGDTVRELRRPKE